VAPTPDVLTDAFEATRKMTLAAVQIANREGADILICIAIAPDGDEDAPEHHYIHDYKVVNGTAGSGAAATPLVLMYPLEVGDVVRVESDGDATFTFFE
jgi:hypothetical protein